MKDITRLILIFLLADWPWRRWIVYASFYEIWSVTILTRSLSDTRMILLFKVMANQFNFPYKICSVFAPVDEPFDLLIVATKVLIPLILFNLLTLLWVRIRFFF